MRKLRLLGCGVVVAGLAACREPLVVDNQNQADKDRTLATAADLETFIGSTYAVAHQGTFGGNDGLQTRSEEHTSELQSRGHLVCRLLLEKKNILRIFRRGFLQLSHLPDAL